MLALARPETSNLLRCLIVAVMVAAGFFVLAFCADGVCASCAHEYCGSTDRYGSDRSKHLLASFAQAVRMALATSWDAERPALLPVVGFPTWAVTIDAPEGLLLQTATLRI